MCFRTFEEDGIEKTGLEWVECVCKRWLHEDCIDYATNVDVDGRIVVLVVCDMCIYYILPCINKTIFLKICSLGDSTYSNACRSSAKKIMQSTVQEGNFPDADNRNTQPTQ